MRTLGGPPVPASPGLTVPPSPKSDPPLPPLDVPPPVELPPELDPPEEPPLEPLDEVLASGRVRPKPEPDLFAPHALSAIALAHTDAARQHTIPKRDVLMGRSFVLARLRYNKPVTKILE